MPSSLKPDSINDSPVEVIEVMVEPMFADENGVGCRGVVEEGEDEWEGEEEIERSHSSSSNESNNNYGNLRKESTSIKQEPEEENDEEEETEGSREQQPSVALEYVQDTRLETPAPQSTCQICGDKATGLHYGIYSCGGCRSFFKRWLRAGPEKYVCKANDDCNVAVYDIGGVKRQRIKCRACRYQACIDAGMHRRQWRLGTMQEQELDLQEQRQRQQRQDYDPVKTEELLTNSAPPTPPFMTTTTTMTTEDMSVGQVASDDNKTTATNDRKRTPRFLQTLKRLIRNNPQISKSALAKKLKVARSTITRALREDLGIKNYGERQRGEKRSYTRVEKDPLMTSAPATSPKASLMTTTSTPTTTTTTGVTVIHIASNDDNKSKEDKFGTDYWTEFEMRQLNYANKDLRDEIEILRSKNRELIARLKEKETQLEIAGKQVNNLRLHLKSSQDLERERFRELDLYRRSNKINNSTSNEKRRRGQSPSSGK